MKNYIVTIEIDSVVTNRLVKAETVGAAESAFGFGKGYLSSKIKDGKCYIENGWEYRRE